MDPKSWLAFLAEIADLADAIALRYFGQRLRVDEKSDHTPVTEADLAIEAAAREQVAQRHPELGILGEEGGRSEGSSDARLVIDPIDATRNFIRGIPVFATLLALEERGEVIAGIVSAPALGTRWSAARGSGGYQGEVRMRVSKIDALERAQLFHGSLAGAEGTRHDDALVALAHRTERQRGFGDFYQHCLVAAGSGEISVDPTVSPWDIGPLPLLVEEAGGRATSLAGERS